MLSRSIDNGLGGDDMKKSTFNVAYDNMLYCIERKQQWERALIRNNDEHKEQHRINVKAINPLPVNEKVKLATKIVFLP